jgi:imidazolonepropionase-like amidohydrolase
MAGFPVDPGYFVVEASGGRRAVLGRVAMNRYERHMIFLLIFGGGLGAIVVRVGSATEEKPIVIRNAKVFDGKKVLPRATVIVRHGLIESVGPDVEPPEGAEVIDGDGRTLLPGFVDAHTHTFMDRHLEQAAVFGVTTELDMASDPKWVATLRTGRTTASPRADLRTAGTPATAPGGHPTQLPPFSFIPTIREPAQAQPFVDARIAEGSDYMKLVYDDGKVYGIHWPTLTPETLAALANAAHARKKLAVAHVSTRDGARIAITAGVDGLVHCFLDEAPDDELVKLFVAKKVFMVPTLTVLESASGTPGGRALTEDSRLSALLAPDDEQNLKASFPRSPRANYRAAQNAVGRLHQAGVPILAGTDAPNPGTAHGASIHRELELLVAAGLTPPEALAAATSVPAKYFQLGDRGVIAAKRRADLILVDGDPTHDIKETRRILAVWQRGRRVDRDGYRKQVASERQKLARVKKAPPPTGSERGLVSDFEGEKISAAFGAGWTVSTDQLFGGKSTAKFTLVAGGANDSKRALLITGNVQEREPRWAGAMFSPGAKAMTPANLSAKKAVAFWARGDDKTYAVMLFFQSHGLGFQPSIRTFVAGSDWKRHRFELKDFDGCDGSDIMGVFIGSSRTPGPFAFHIDDVVFE